MNYTYFREANKFFKLLLPHVYLHRIKTKYGIDANIKIYNNGKINVDLSIREFSRFKNFLIISSLVFRYKHYCNLYLQSIKEED